MIDNNERRPNNLGLCDKTHRDSPWKHKRRAITTHAIDYWVGWKRIMDLHNKAVELDKDLDQLFHSLYFSVIFETGGRAGEVVLLRPEQIHIEEDHIKITRMKVLKHRKTFVRNVYIKIDQNPLAPIFIKHVEKCKTKFLLPGYGNYTDTNSKNKFSRRINPDRHISTTHVYNNICEIDKDIWPHWLRDQRSWQLYAKVEEGGRELDSFELKDWFGWARMDMPAHYAGRRSDKDILRRLGVKDI